MDININRIRKLTDKELLDYFNKSNIYKSDAVIIAVKILKEERNYHFSDLEKQEIEKVVNSKKEKERLDYFNRNNEVSDTAENKHYPKINSESLVIKISAILSIAIGGYFIYKNLKILNLDTKKNILQLFISVLFCLILVICVLLLYRVYMYDFMLEIEKRRTSFNRHQITAKGMYFLIYMMTNSFLSLLVWSAFIKDGIKYRTID